MPSGRTTSLRPAVGPTRPASASCRPAVARRRRASGAPVVVAPRGISKAFAATPRLVAGDADGDARRAASSLTAPPGPQPPAWYGASSGARACRARARARAFDALVPREGGSPADAAQGARYARAEPRRRGRARGRARGRVGLGAARVSRRARGGAHHGLSGDAVDEDVTLATRVLAAVSRRCDRALRNARARRARHGRASGRPILAARAALPSAARPRRPS